MDDVSTQVLGNNDVDYELDSSCNGFDISYQTLENESQSSFIGHRSQDPILDAHGDRLGAKRCEDIHISATSTLFDESFFEVLSSDSSSVDVCNDDDTHDVDHEVNVVDTTSFHSANFDSVACTSAMNFIVINLSGN